MTALLGVSTRALRYYEERGLVQGGRDGQGQRTYDARARRRLEWIVELRRAGIRLSVIEEILTFEDEPERAAELAADALYKEAERTRARLDDIDEALRRCARWAAQA